MPLNRILHPDSVNYRRKRLFLASACTLVFLLCFRISLSGQCSTLTPSFTLNLSGSANASASTPTASRNGTCCGGSDPCVKVTVLLHPKAAAIRLTPTGADPGGALVYELNCTGIQIPGGTAVCIAGSNAATLTICKVGNNPNSYSVESIPQPTVTDSVFVMPGCTRTLTATGFSASTIQWTAVNSGSNTSLYNGFLSCTSGCSVSVLALTSASNLPAYIDYEVSGYGLAPCGTTVFRDTARVWIYPALTSTVSGKLVCYGSGTAALTASVSGGKPVISFTWSPGASNSASIPATPGNYTVIVGDQTGCPPVMTTVSVLQMTAAISAAAANSMTLCKLSPTVPLSGTVTGVSTGVWSSSGTGSFLPFASVMNASFVPSSAVVSSGSVQLYLNTTNNEGCAPGSHTMTVWFQDPPQIIAIPDLTVCANNVVSVLNGTITGFPASPVWSAGGSGALSSPASLSTSFTPGFAAISGGSATVVLTTTNNGVCPAAADTVIVYITPSPTVIAGMSFSICSGRQAQLGGTVNPGTFGGIWSTSGDGGFLNSSALSTSYTPGTNDQLSQTVTLSLTTTSNGLCNAVHDTVVITIVPLPNLTVTGGTVCAGSAFTLFPSGAGTYTYSGGGSVVTPSATTSYTVTGSGGGGCTNSAVATVTVHPLPLISISGTGSVCSGNTATLVAGGAVTYTWQPGALTGGSVVLSPTATLFYTVNGADIFGCADTGTYLLTVHPTPTVTVNSGSICAGRSFVFNPAGANSYGLPGGSGTVSPSGTTVYSISGTSQQGCVSAPVSATVVVFPPPLITVSSGTICAGDSVKIVAGGGISYTWSNGTTGNMITVSPPSSTIFSVTGTDDRACTGSAAGQVIVFKCTGMNDLTAGEGLRLFPNPASSFFSVCGGKGGMLVVEDLRGRTLCSIQLGEDCNEISVGQNRLQPGFYLCRVLNTGGQLAVKWIVVE